MSRTVRTGADALVEGLIAAGVEHVFGLPGDTGVDLYAAMYRFASSIRHIMCRDERHAAAMADAYARCRNEVGVVEVSSGGGATYCVGGLGEPFAASVPVLVISSDIHASSRGTGALTELDQEKLFSAVTKWVRRVDRVDSIPSMLAEAITAATSDRPAPVALILPENVLSQKTTAPIGTATTSLPARRLAADPQKLAMIASALIEAERPAIVVGGGVHMSRAYDELARLADAAAVPVATTIQGKGAYAESASWCLGVAGANGGRPYVNDYLSTADFVLFVGTRANATDTNSYKCPPRSTRVAQIDISADRAGRNYPGSVSVVADAKTALAALADRVADRSPRREALRRHLEDSRRAWYTIDFSGGTEGLVHPLEVLKAVHDAFGDEALIVADCGTATPYLAAHWDISPAGRRLLMARGHGPMGYAIPAAVGAALASPSMRVVAITTDGSFGMSCGELETVARLQLPITFIQLTNGSYGWIKMLQHLYHHRQYFGVDISRVDTPAIVRGFGVPAVRAEAPEALRDALQGRQRAAGPAFVEVVIPDMIALEPPVAPWTAALSGADAVRPVY